MDALAKAEGEAATIKIVDRASSMRAAAIHAQLTRAGMVLEHARIGLLRPFLDAQTAINQAAKTASSRIALTKGALNAQLTSYDTAQRALAAQAEAKRLREQKERDDARQAELKRLERIRFEEQEAQKRMAQELLDRAMAEQAKPSYVPAPFVIDLDDEEPPPPPGKSEVDRQIEALRHAPILPSLPIVAPKIGGLIFRQSLRIVSTDLEQLPDSFVTRTPDLTRLRETYCTGWKDGAPLPECPGVVFEVVKTPVSR